jgi:hypothetical protein
MAILAGPGVTDLVIASSLQSATPVGPLNEVGDPIELAIIQLLKSMGQLTSLLMLIQHRRRKDDFMRGWGEPGGEMEP